MTAPYTIPLARKGEPNPNRINSVAFFRHFGAPNQGRASESTVGK